ncbi:MAG: HEAT repeat domain-containing protein [Planctomycetales bacterium]|nr:HEAT repeat domain-containing protein [Planctomycetales bacterium]
MPSALATTFRVLADSGNEAATDVLIAALDSPRPRIQDEALRTILERRSVAGCREILRRLHAAPAPWRTILAEYQGRMTGALRDAALSTETQVCENACQAILWFGEYDLVPSLVTAAEDTKNPNSDLVAQTVLSLAEALYHELATPHDYTHRLEPQRFRSHAISGLEPTLEHFPQHRKTELVEACLVLVDRDNVTLQQILHDADHPSHAGVVQVLRTSERPGIIRLALSFLEEHNAPAAAVEILAQRADLKFLRHLLNKSAGDLNVTATRNLRRMHDFSLLAGDLSVLDQFDDRQQAGAIQLLKFSGVKRDSVFRVLRYVLSKGKAQARRAAIRALEDFSGAEANQLTDAAAGDEDAEVRATALAQLRNRGIPGAMRTLIMNIDNPHEVVREAVRESLKEFSFERYLGAFDMMEEEARHATGELVRRLDPSTLSRIRQELELPSRTRRLRAIEISVALELVPKIQSELVELLTCDDHMIRAEAASALAASPTTTAVAALQKVVDDPSFSVQEAAQDSLRQIARHMAPSADEGGNS